MGLDLKGSVSLDGSGWETGIKKLEKGADSFAHSMKHVALAAAGFYGAEEAIRKTVEYAEHLVDQSRRLGVGIEALQEFGFAAEQTGSSMEKLTGFVEKLNSARIDPKKMGAFAKFGIDQNDLKSAPVEELLMKISASVQNRGAQEVIGPLRQIGGKGAGEFLPMLQENLEELRKKAHEVGVVMNTKTAVELKYFSDQLKILSQILVVGLGPALVLAGENLIDFINIIKSAGTFWGSFLGNPKSGYSGSGVISPVTDFVGRIGDSLKSLGSGNFKYPWEAGSSSMWESIGSLGSGNFKYPWETKPAKDLVEAFTDAGKTSESELEASRASTAAKIAELIATQKKLEALNANPHFELPDAKEEKLKFGKLPDGDSLTRVGNFLGAGRDSLRMVAERQVNLLQQIANNTKRMSEPSGPESFDDTFWPQQ